MHVDDPNQVPAPDPQNTPPPETPPAITPPPAPLAPPPAQAGGEGKTVVIPTKAMAKIKSEERDKGRKAAQVQLEERARKAGFASAQEMEEFAMKARRQQSQPQAPRAAAPAATTSTQAAPIDRNLRRAERDRDRALEEVKKANRLRATEEKKRKEMERQLSSMQAEMELRTAAIKAGVQDVDYAISLLKRKVSGKTKEQIGVFDETAFFEKELRASHPYLYSVVDRPVSTAAAPAPTAPKGTATSMPAQQPTASPQGPVDARKMTPEQYNSLLKNLGVRRNLV